MLPLPDQVGREEQQRHRGTEPDPRLRELPAQRREHHRGRHRDAEEDRRVLVLQAQPDEGAEASQRRESPVRTRRSSTHAAPIQNSGSNAFIVITLPSIR